MESEQQLFKRLGEMYLPLFSSRMLSMKEDTIRVGAFQRAVLYLHACRVFQG